MKFGKSKQQKFSHFPRLWCIWPRLRYAHATPQNMITLEIKRGIYSEDRSIKDNMKMVWHVQICVHLTIYFHFYVVLDIPTLMHAKSPKWLVISEQIFALFCQWRLCTWYIKERGWSVYCSLINTTVFFWLGTAIIGTLTQFSSCSGYQKEG